jgi:hypothetical protein
MLAGLYFEACWVYAQVEPVILPQLNAMRAQKAVQTGSKSSFISAVAWQRYAQD